MEQVREKVMRKNVFMLDVYYTNGEEVHLRFEDRGEALAEIEYFKENKSLFRRNAEIQCMFLAKKPTSLTHTKGKLIELYANQFEQLEDNEKLCFEEWTLEEWLKDNHISYRSIQELLKNKVFDDRLECETTDLFLILTNGAMKKAVDAGMLKYEDNPFNQRKHS